MASLFSSFLNTVTPGRRRVRPTQTVGAMGTAVYGGYIVTNETDPALTGIERYRTFSDMLANTTIVGGGVRYFLNLAAKVEWKVNPADDSDAAREVAEFIEQLMFEDLETPWERVVRRACMYRFYGFSVQEWTAKRREDGMLTMADIAPRAQLTIEQWDVDEQGDVLGVVQRSPQTNEYIYLPREKILYVVDDTLNDSPEGLGLFRHVVSSSTRLERYEQLEGFGYETDLRGVPLGRAPIGELTQQQQNNTLKDTEVTNRLAVLTNFIKKHIKNPQLGLVLDSATYRDRGENQTPSSTYQYDMELLQGDNPSMDQIAAAIDRVNREIARVLGVEHLLLGDGDRGSEALARSKADNFALIVESTLNEVVSAVEKDIVQTAMRLNDIDEELTPELTVNSVTFRDPFEIARGIRDMAQAGAVLTPDDPAINDMRDLFGITRQPMMDMDEDATIGDNVSEDEAMDNLEEEDQEDANRE